jgi:hypothetical protein
MVRSTSTFPLVLLALVALLAGCSDRDLSELDLAPINDDPVVFDDDFGDGVDFQAFQGSQLDAVSIDAAETFGETAGSLKITVPGPGSLNGTFAGGAFTSGYRDLSGYDALVFQAKSSVPSTLNVAGLGNDNTGNSLYTVERSAIALTSDWQQVVIPIPDPSRLTLERGLFHFAEGHEAGAGFTIWFDEVRFARMGTILDPRPTMATRTIDTFVDGTVTPEETRVTFAVNGEDVTVAHSPHYFDYASSDSTVAVTSGSVITAVGVGTALITARLDTVAVAGTVTLNVLASPTTPAPAPVYQPADVIALFSEPYTPITVDTWRATWSMSGPVTDFAVAGNAAKVYTGLIYAGIEFVHDLVDATDMTHVRMDVWAPAGTIFRLKLVDFGDDGIFGGAPDSQWELVFHGSSDPAFVAGQWSVLDVPLSRFSLTSRAHLAQIVISTPDARTVFVDNVLFHR